MRAGGVVEIVVSLIRNRSNIAPARLCSLPRKPVDQAIMKTLIQNQGVSMRPKYLPLGPGYLASTLAARDWGDQRSHLSMDHGERGATAVAISRAASPDSLEEQHYYRSKAIK